MYVRHSSVIYSTLKMTCEQPVVAYHYKLHGPSLKDHKLRASEGKVTNKRKKMDFRLWECMLLHTANNASYLRLLKQLNQEGHWWDTVQVVRNSICIQNVDGFTEQSKMHTTLT
jgi:hypothetical protein